MHMYLYIYTYIFSSHDYYLPNFSQDYYLHDTMIIIQKLPGWTSRSDGTASAGKGVECRDLAGEVVGMLG